MREDEERRDFYSLYASTQTRVLRLFFYEMQLHKRTAKHDKLFHGFMLKDTQSLAWQPILSLYITRPVWFSLLSTTDQL